MDWYQKAFIDHLGPTHPHITVDVISIIIAILALLLNMLLLYVEFNRHQGKWAIDAVLICIIATFDIVLCNTLMLSVISRWIIGPSVFDPESMWCHFSAIFFTASTVSTVLSTALLALVRYLALVCDKTLSNRLFITIAVVLNFITWVLFIYRGLTAMLFVLPSGLYCAPQLYGSDLTTNFSGLLVTLMVAPSLILIPFCYIKITLHYRRIIKTMSNIKGSQVMHKLSRNILGLCGALVAYAIAIFPEFIHVIFSILSKTHRTSLSDGIVITLLFSITIINALFALLVHDNIREEFLFFLRSESPRGPGRFLVRASTLASSGGILLNSGYSPDSSSTFHHSNTSGV